MRIIKQPTFILDSIETIHFSKDGSIISKRLLNSGKFHRFLKWLKLVHDSMTNDAFANIAGLFLTDVGGTAYDYIGIGTGVIAADPTDHALGTPAGVRKASIGTRVTTGGITDNTAQLVHTFSQADDATLTGTAQAITEIGVFYHPTNDHTMALRQKYTPADTMNWDQGDSLQVTVKVQIKQGS